MRFILVRHGETLQNNGLDYGTIDSKAVLSERGIKQTNYAVKKISELLIGESYKTIVYYSPYIRTKVMAELLNNKIKLYRCIEEPLITEIQCGLFEGMTIKMYKQINPLEYEKFLRYRNENCRFWYKFPEGEAPFDVYVRIRLFLTLINQTNSQVNNYVNIIISHFNTLKVLELCLLNKDLEWYEKNSGFDNAEIHVIDDGKLTTRIKYYENESF